MNKLNMTCGCSFQTDGKLPNGMDRILFQPDIARIDHTINFSCPATWKLLSDGFTKGVFQLETHLGISYAKKLKPEGMEHLSALGAILRPGTLESKTEEGVSFTDLYCLRKNGEAEVVHFHSDLEDILGTSYGLIIYQEQLMKITAKFANFDLNEQDKIRKSSGKKSAEIMAECRKLFMEKGAKLGLMDEVQLKQTFDWIEKSQRYLFNKSHSLSYAKITYVTAYIKQHFPLAFYLSWLTYAKDKMDPMEEMKNLVKDAKLFDVEIYPPTIEFLESEFHSDGKSIYFGLVNIKGIGESQFRKLKALLEPLDAEQCRVLQWIDFLLSSNLSSTAMQNLIKTGALRKFGKQRLEMLREYEIWKTLTEREKKLILDIYEFDFKFDCELTDLLEALLENPKGVTSLRRPKIESEIKLLRNPPCSLEDTLDYIVSQEEQLLGLALTCQKIDHVCPNKSNVNCKELIRDKLTKGLVCAEVKRIKETRTKTGNNPGQKMGFVNIEDGYAEMDVVVFSNEWAMFSHLFIEGNRLYFDLRLTEKGGYQAAMVYEVT